MMRPNVRGRRMKVRMRGGRRVVKGRVERRKDFMDSNISIGVGEMRWWKEEHGVGWIGKEDVRRTSDSPIIFR